MVVEIQRPDLKIKKEKGLQHGHIMVQSWFQLNGAYFYVFFQNEKSFHKKDT